MTGYLTTFHHVKCFFAVFKPLLNKTAFYTKLLGGSFRVLNLKLRDSLH